MLERRVVDLGVPRPINWLPRVSFCVAVDDWKRGAVDSKETQVFAERLMRQVWEPLDSTDVPQFYHRDVIGHHEGYHGSQELNYEDIVNRLDWDRQSFSNPVYDIRDIIAGEDKFAVRFIYTATITATGEEAKAEAAYFYHLKDGKISEFWLLADIDFDYKQKPS